MPGVVSQEVQTVWPVGLPRRVTRQSGPPHLAQNETAYPPPKSFLIKPIPILRVRKGGEKADPLPAFDAFGHFISRATRLHSGGWHCVAMLTPSGWR